MNYLLRPWSPSDLASLVKYANNYNIAKNLTGHFPYPYTEAAGNRFISMATSATPTRIFAIEIDGEAAGGVGVHPQEDIHIKCAEMGYWLAEPHWGKGIMTNVVKDMIAYAFENFDIVRLYARPFSSNIGSQKVLEKAGFNHEATLKKSIFKNDEIQDELIYSIVR